jgi:hypothetical protein
VDEIDEQHRGWRDGDEHQRQPDQRRVNPDRHEQPDRQSSNHPSCSIQRRTPSLTAVRGARATTQPASLIGLPKRVAAPRPLAAMATASVDVPPGGPPVLPRDLGPRGPGRGEPASTPAIVAMP